MALVTMQCRTVTLTCLQYRTASKRQGLQNTWRRNMDADDNMQPANTRGPPFGECQYIGVRVVAGRQAGGQAGRQGLDMAVVK